MKSLPDPLKTHLKGSLTSLAWCARLLRSDGVLYAGTSHDQPLIIEGITYRAQPGLQPGAIDAAGPLLEGSGGMAWAIAYDDLSQDELIAGRFDNARFSLFLVNWREPAAGRVVMLEGILGDIRLNDGRFEGTVEGLATRLNKPVGHVTSPTCRADLGDKKCRVALRPLTDGLLVTSPPDDDAWIAVSGPSRPIGWYEEGRLTWTHGANAGLKSRVADHYSGQIRLMEVLPRPIRAGDRCLVTAGCDKRLATCRAKFSNAINFRGEPFLPGNDQLLDYPGLP